MSKLRARYEKLGDLKYISHLDTMRMFERTFRRAGIDIKYTQGFNKHAIMSFASPMAIGLTGEDEYIDIELNTDMEEGEFIKKVNECFPEGVRVTKAAILDEKEKAIMGKISGALYEMVVETNKEIDLESELKKLDKMENIIVIKKGKKGEHEVDIKPMIYNIHCVRIDGLHHKVEMMVACGSSMNLSMDVFMDAAKEHLPINDAIEDYSVHRRRLYIGERENLKRPIED